MSSLYPSLEDMQVHKMMEAQENAVQANFQQPQYAQNAYPQLYGGLSQSDNNMPTLSPPSSSSLYPFMGLELTEEMIVLNMPEYARGNQIAVASTNTSAGMIAPLSSQTPGLQRAQVTHGIREVMVCKGKDNKIGLRVRDIDNGVFITLVCKDSPAALVG